MFNIEHGKPVFFANNTEGPFIALFSLGIDTMCPHRSNCSKNTEKRKNFKKRYKKKLREMKKIQNQSFFQNGLSLYSDFRTLSYETSYFVRI